MQIISFSKPELIKYAVSFPGLILHNGREQIKILQFLVLASNDFGK